MTKNENNSNSKNKKLKNVSSSAKTNCKNIKEKTVAKNKTRLTAKHEKRLKKLILGTALGSIILLVSTYAWFIGMKTVNVSEFDVSVAAIEGLSLSLNGSTWSDKVIINGDNYNDTSVVYSGNTNSWSGDGLVPLSSIGQINGETSRLRMYKKGSFTVTPGGYRIMASEIVNTNAKEQDGYVVFDLFIKNMSGNKYYDTSVNILNEEAIYLTPESTVKVAATGDNEENSGIENSVRVAFAQIGRVKSNSTASVITGITCKTEGQVLGICSDRNAQIWEPNDTKHVQNAINWYKTSCKKRIGADLTKEASYSGSCNSVVDGVAVPTYVVSGEIDANDRVDAYDGQKLNGYTATISATPAKGKLYELKTFTDTMKHKEGNQRPTFMMLAPNSVTKVRVYVYLEGQDVDNYDFASLGKKISVEFGFTKQRYYGDDVDYNKSEPNGPALPEGMQSRATGTV